MSDARRRAEEALRYDHDHANSPEVRRRLRGAIEALLAAGPEAPPPPSDAVREAKAARPKGDIWDACGCPNPDDCEHVFYEPAPSDAVREAAEALEPIDTIKVACGTADKADVAQRIGRARVALDAALRANASPAPGSDAVREAAEDVVRGDWWGHYCPCCGSTYKHGPECLIGRLAEALAEARAARGGAG